MTSADEARLLCTGHLNSARIHVLPIVGCVYRMSFGDALCVGHVPKFSRVSSITGAQFVTLNHIIFHPGKLDYLHAAGHSVLFPGELYTWPGGNGRFLGHQESANLFTTAPVMVLALHEHVYELREKTMFTSD